LRTLERKEAWSLLWSAIAALSPRDREIIQSHYFEGRTHREIADRDGVSCETIKTRFRRAIARLRRRLPSRGLA
jgi:RNA polymerase sigma-70 factor (ECF subfamily)